MTEIRSIFRIPLSAEGIDQILRVLRQNLEVPEARERLSPYKDNLSAYLDFAKSDIEHMINAVGMFSAMNTPHDGKMDFALQDGTLRCSLEDSLEFDAYIEDVNATKYRIMLSPGMLFALDDIIFRAFCNQGFFSHEPNPPFKQLWNGCMCYFAPMGRELPQPGLRFIDYSPKNVWELSAPKGANFRWFLYQPIFFSGVPIESEERIDCAALCTFMAVAWIILHEAAHYRSGHLETEDQSILRIFRRRRRRLGATRQTDTRGTGRAIEFQADILATQYVVDIFFNNGWTGYLPHYAKREAPWLARLIAVTLGMVTLIMEKVRQKHGSTGNYPSPMVRMATIICVVVNRVHEHLGDRSRTYNAKNQSILYPSILFDNMIIRGAMIDLSCAAQMLDESHFIDPSTGRLERNDNLGFRYPMPLYGDVDQIQPAIDDMFHISRMLGSTFEMPLSILDDWRVGVSKGISLIDGEMKSFFATTGARQWASELADLIKQNAVLSSKLDPICKEIRGRHPNPFLGIVPGW